MKMSNEHCPDVCKLPKIEITWDSYGEKVSKIMVNDSKASAFVDRLHSDSVNYSVEFV